MPPSLSVCLIVRNQARTLKRCLESVKAMAEALELEIVVVDTGSTDESLAIAQSFTERVYAFKWCDDFSAARNYGLDQAQGDWILCLDGDEWLDPASAEKLPAFLASLEPGQPLGFSFLAPAPGQTYFKRALFSNQPEIRFKGRVHEGLFWLHKPLPLIENPKFTLNHEPATSQEQRAKALGYLPLIQAELATTLSADGRANLLRHFADTCCQLGRLHEARQAYADAMSAYRQTGLPLNDGFYLNLLLCLLSLMEFPPDAAQAARLAQELTEVAPQHGIGWWNLAWAKLWLNLPDESLMALERFVACMRPTGEMLWKLNLVEARCLLSGEPQLALQQLRELVKSWPQIDLLRYHLAHALMISGLARDAMFCLQDLALLETPQETLQFLLEQRIWTPSELSALKQLNPLFL
jgi:tetratricopeptide (TPR) repeat protein